MFKFGSKRFLTIYLFRLFCYDYRLEDISEDFSIMFLGSSVQWRQRRSDILRRDDPHSGLLACSGRKIMQWLRVMRAADHCAYRHLPEDAFNLSSSIIDALEILPELLVDNAHCADSAIAAAIDDYGRAR